jgi:tRNA dimethylallyltransferase
VADPDEEFNAALSADAARAQIARLRQEGKTGFVVGGTGLYIRALLRGIIATPPVDEAIRRHYQNLRDRFGRAHVYRLLCEKDPAAAARLNPNDSVRVIRALEVFEQSGQSIVVLQDRHAFADCPYEALKIGLRIERTNSNRGFSTEPRGWSKRVSSRSGTAGQGLQRKAQIHVSLWATSR